MRLILYDSLGTIRDVHWSKEQLAIANSLVKSGSEVLVVTGKCSLDQPPHEFRIRETSRTRLNVGSLFGETLEIITLVRRLSPDALICHRRLPSLTTVALLRLARMRPRLRGSNQRSRPLCLLQSDFASEPGATLSKKVETVFLALYGRIFDVMIVETTCQAAKLQWIGAPRHKVVLIPMGYDQSELSTHLKSEGTSRRKVILFVGRIAPQKGIETLIRAFSRIQGRIPDWSLVIVGPAEGESYRRSLAELIAESGCSHAITMTGQVDRAKLESLYESSSLFCQPSLYEGSSIARIEAIVHRLPLVISPTGCCEDWKRRGAAVFPTNDDLALAQTLERLANDPTERDRMVRAGISHGILSWDEAAGVVRSEIVTRLLGPKSGPPRR